MATARRRAGGGPAASGRVGDVNPWNALWAMMVGFFMILLDSTIVAVANPSIMNKLGTGYDTVIWVTSAYLLAYAVPLLVAARLGDRYGPKNLYLAGLAVFTLASLWCGLSGSIGMLITARMVQGIGAGLLTPQTLSTITRTFPAERRGVAMSMWGATAGVATLVGPLAGGILVDALGWAWIFFVNVPIGIIGLGLAYWLVPSLPTHKHRFDLIGVGLSAVGMFLIVFALQEGQSGGWAPWIWAVLVAGIGFMSAFIYWQSLNTHEPLVPLGIFRDRGFSLANVGVVVISFVATAMVLPLMFYAQAVCGLSPTRAALLTAPMAVTSGVLAPFVGRIIDRVHPQPLVGFGFSALAIGVTWLSFVMTATVPIWELVLPFFVLGIGMAFIWAPLATTATRNLPDQVAGASSGVYNATRQVGAVLGSAGMASFMTSRISSHLPPMPDGVGSQGDKGAALQLPEFLREPFATAMSQSMLLPAFVALFGVAAALFMLDSAGPARRGRQQRADDATSEHGDVQTRRVRVRPSAADSFENDGIRGGFDDDDDYVEYTLTPAPAAPPRRPRAAVRPPIREDRTEPLPKHVDHPRPSPAENWRGAPVESWQSLLEDLGSEPDDEPIGLADNGLHVDDEQRFRPVEEFSPREYRPIDRVPDFDEPFFDDIDTYGGGTDRPRHSGPAGDRGDKGNGYHPPPRGERRRADPDDGPRYGRHSHLD
ncbi:MFS transporter [Mycobacterium cookii]|uniref:MFS transporter n=1 Tax=Mycobacterium cookii TaxID=1775 RepID=UPI0035573345